MPETDIQGNIPNALPLARRGGCRLTRAACLKAGIAGMCWMLAGPSIRAQDALKYSLAGDAVAEAQREQFATQLYTIREGDFKLLVVPSLELDYNDNITLQRDDALSDFILKPLVTLTGGYPVTAENLLTFNTGVGYDEYLEHGQYSAVRVNSDSALSFDMRIKDFLINVHDQFSYFQDPSAEAAIAQTAVYGGLLNSAGLSGTWDLEALRLTLGYDHQNFISSSGQFDYLNRASELFVARAGLTLRPDITVGVEGTASYTGYDQQVLNDNQGYSAGIYANWHPDPMLYITPRAGYAIYQLDQTSESAEVFDLTPSGVPVAVPTGEVVQTSSVNTWYASLDITNKLTESVGYSVHAGHEIRLGLQSDLIEDSYFRPEMNWMIIKDLWINSSLFYEHGHQGIGNVTGNFTETYDWYGGALMLSYPIMKRLLMSLSYRLTLRSSDIPSREYSQNIVGIKFSYQPK
jgi:hypothetical protein